jgi:hypothetical protein
MSQLFKYILLVKEYFSMVMVANVIQLVFPCHKYALV